MPPICFGIEFEPYHLSRIDTTGDTIMVAECDDITDVSYWNCLSADEGYKQMSCLAGWNKTMNPCVIEVAF